MRGAQAAPLPGGRLHLHHGPIDLVIGAEGAGRRAAMAAAGRRFAGILEELVEELDLLRRPLGACWPQGPVARRMARAVAPFGEHFITPMAAVAGAVADEILQAMAAAGPLTRAHVNNGGDIAFHLAPGESLVAAIHDPGGEDGAGEGGAGQAVGGGRFGDGGHAGECIGGRVHLCAALPVRGIATSGRGGRSLSLGIADAVTVLAPSAAAADAAATLIANAVDLPGHPAIRRRPAREIDPDSDLGRRLVTVGLGPLSRPQIAQALRRGLLHAEAMRARGLIAAAALFLRGESLATDEWPALSAPPGKATGETRRTA